MAGSARLRQARLLQRHPESVSAVGAGDTGRIASGASPPTILREGERLRLGARGQRLHLRTWPKRQTRACDRLPLKTKRADRGEALMLTKRMRKAVEAIEQLSEAEQDQLAAAIERALEQPAVSSDTVRPEVAAAFTDMPLDMSA